MPLRVRIALVSTVALTISTTACSTHYWNVVPIERSGTASDSRPIAFAGVWDATGEARLVEEATQLVATETRFPDLSKKLTPQDAGLLLADSAEIQSAAEWRGSFVERTAHRRIAIGGVAASPVLDVRIWVVQLVIPAVYTIILIPIPITYATTPDVPHGSIFLRVIDLESGAVQGEYFEITHNPPGEGGFDEDVVARAIDRIGSRGHK